jgi:hypothetical protein
MKRRARHRVVQENDCKCARKIQRGTGADLSSSDALRLAPLSSTLRPLAQTQAAEMKSGRNGAQTRKLKKLRASHLSMRLQTNDSASMQRAAWSVWPTHAPGDAIPCFCDFASPGNFGQQNLQKLPAARKKSPLYWGGLALKR